MARNQKPAPQDPALDKAAAEKAAADKAAADKAAADRTALEKEALAKMQGMFTPERWAKIERQAANSSHSVADGLPALCAELFATRAARHPDNAAAASAAAANGLLIALGSTLKDEDKQRFADALQGGSKPAAAPAPSAPADTAAALPETPAQPQA
jgi:hypothetical protein